GAIIVDKVRNESDAAVGFNADEEKVQNLVDAGVIDPTKVVRVAIQNASSIAGLLLTTEALISELPEKKKAGPPMPGGGGYDDFD
ncbi:MAG TPA: TCP-1/cpn60 chaperonin family protein, partial [Terriglobia bacterium]|nr:TCP-1/cpn60 chaperonin family protein [Terriglobia bacterium]